MNQDTQHTLTVVAQPPLLTRNAANIVHQVLDKVIEYGPRNVGLTATDLLAAKAAVTALLQGDRESDSGN